MNDTAEWHQLQIFADQVETAPLAVRPLVAVFPPGRAFLTQTGIVQTVRAQKPRLDQPRFGVGAVNRLATLPHPDRLPVIRMAAIKSPGQRSPAVPPPPITVDASTPEEP
jgi:hypothetical protein